jgi:hypothetical protein
MCGQIIDATVKPGATTAPDTREHLNKRATAWIWASRFAHWR